MKQYDITWNSPSKNSSESMPFGGHSIGGNVWVEGDTLYFYLAQTGWFDENNSLLKAGRFCITATPSPFGGSFSQQLLLESGRVLLQCEDMTVLLWAETGRPAVHVEIHSETARRVTASYQSWRFRDRKVDHLSYELFQCKEVFYYPLADATFHRDTIEPRQNDLFFYHQNDAKDLSFYKEIVDQGLESHCDELYNPQKNRIMGGQVDFGPLMYSGYSEGVYQDTACRSFAYRSETPLQDLEITVALLVQIESQISRWKQATTTLLHRAMAEKTAARAEAECWWKQYWAKSYIKISENQPGSKAWQIGRNYNLFRFMLGLNAQGRWPTKFNGGLLTFDPSLGGDSPWSDDPLHYTPDFRLWGGGSHTIQNQRLVYWPMLKSGDFSMMTQHFEFFLRLLPNARCNVAAHHLGKGAMFPEQVGSYGLCCGCDNEWGNQTGLPVAQIKYHFSNSLETALMMLDYADFTDQSVTPFLPFIHDILSFYDTFYPQNDAEGNMILYPANALETFHVIKNPIDAIAGLNAVLTRLLALPESETAPAERSFWKRLQQRVPPLPTTQKEGKTIFAAAETTSQIHNCEIPQLYPVHPYGLYGLGKPGLEMARDTARLAPETEEQQTHISWHPTGIQFARLGMLPEAWTFLEKKMGDGPFRFPAFWGPGHDWTPDHNWGGSGMVQLQEMLIQTDGDQIRLLPCWPAEVDVSFRLFAPHNTVVECVYKNGKIETLSVTPSERRKDVLPGVASIP